MAVLVLTTAYSDSGSAPVVGKGLAESARLTHTPIALLRGLCRDCAQAPIPMLRDGDLPSAVSPPGPPVDNPVDHVARSSWAGSPIAKPFLSPRSISSR
jgi:hypothetical protein